MPRKRFQHDRREKQLVGFGEKCTPANNTQIMPQNVETTLDGKNTTNELLALRYPSSSTNGVFGQGFLLVMDGVACSDTAENYL